MKTTPSTLGRSSAPGPPASCWPAARRTKRTDRRGPPSARWSSSPRATPPTTTASAFAVVARRRLRPRRLPRRGRGRDEQRRGLPVPPERRAGSTAGARSRSSSPATPADDDLFGCRRRHLRRLRRGRGGRGGRLRDRPGRGLCLLPQPGRGRQLGPGQEARRRATRPTTTGSATPSPSTGTTWSSARTARTAPGPTGARPMSSPGPGRGGQLGPGRQARLPATPTTINQFGYRRRHQGGFALVGSPGEDGAGTDRGAAYVFSRTSGGADDWGQVKKLVPSDPTDDVWFGTARGDRRDLGGRRRGLGRRRGHEPGRGLRLRPGPGRRGQLGPAQEAHRERRPQFRLVRLRRRHRRDDRRRRRRLGQRRAARKGARPISSPRTRAGRTTGARSSGCGRATARTRIGSDTRSRSRRLVPPRRGVGGGRGRHRRGARPTCSGRSRAGSAVRLTGPRFSVRIPWTAFRAAEPWS